MDMDVGTVRVIDQPMVDDTRTLLKTHSRLRMDAKVEAIEIVNALSHPFHHRGQETAKRIRLAVSLDLGDFGVLNRQAHRAAEVRGYADVA